MNNSSNNGSPDDGEEHGELVWNEFDWERYLRQRDDAVAEYQQAYERTAGAKDRLDEVARDLGWEPTLDGDLGGEGGSDEFDDNDLDPYTLHRNPVYVASRALFAGLIQYLESIVATPQELLPLQAFRLLRVLHDAEMAIVLGVQALDLGDTALGISQLKRALGLLNSAMASLPDAVHDDAAEASALHGYALPRLFDLREICLRVIREGRQELERPLDDDEQP